MAVQLVENVLGSQHSFKHLEHPDRSAVSLHVNVPDLAALGDARWEVRADALHQLLGLEGPQLAPYAEAVLPLVADPVSEVRRRACELIHKLDITVLHGLKDVESPRMSFLRCGKTWKCLCVPGSMPVPPSHLTADLQDLHSKQEDSEGSSHRTACTQLPRHLADGFNTPKAIGRSRPQEVDERLLAEMGHGHPVDSIEWLGTLVNAPNLLEMANEGNEGNEGHWYHWKVRDALAFSVRELQGTALVQLLADAETVVREDALIALRRLPSHLWVHHTRWVTQSLVDPMPQVRMAALCALQRLSSVELALQAPWVVQKLQDEDAEVRAAALLTLRFLKPDHLKHWAEQARSERLRNEQWRGFHPPQWQTSPALDCQGTAFFDTVKAVGIGSSLAVHAASSAPSSDLLEAKLSVSQDVIDNDPASVAVRAKAWQEKVAVGVAQRLLSRHNSTARLGAALEASSDKVGGTKRPAPEEPRSTTPEHQDRRPSQGNPHPPLLQDPFRPGFLGDRPIWWMPEGGLLGPRHPAWGQVAPGRSGGMMPRFDPIGPGDPDPDHFVPGGLPGNPGGLPTFHGGRPGRGSGMDPDGIFFM
ncbi:unnamed protein product [Symbiodinium natans]|uniref:Uncharacterized protein n=1 Tax=Symbiodinium natans TaxID=878477 RepID=A0A812I9D7_9DINO|nr:unnamed protein product [Symbiodinium natans]